MGTTEKIKCFCYCLQA
uniref:Uncharacterized protein n=1 Tax=Rhizophora mucronata TaxID=61149 RepID=A0A2P2PAL5_RHIMU